MDIIPPFERNTVILSILKAFTIKRGKKDDAYFVKESISQICFILKPILKNVIREEFVVNGGAK